VLVIPTNRPLIRVENPDVVFRTEREKNEAVVKEARIAVRTPSGQALAYAEALESGKARLFVARTCAPD